MQRAWEWRHFTHGKQNTCLPIFDCLQVERATRQRYPLLQLKTKQLMLPARRWKRSLQLGICRGIRWKHFTDGKQIPVCQSLIVYKQRARRGNVAFFSIRHKTIDASSSSLEAIIATLLPADGTAKKAIFRRQSSS